ncbi:MAG UNVERIFIED_CONTAM: hypothetical protein LVR18_11705 [Planctomycetaceae bacterium]|jgi:hypothetical protein
MRLGGRTGEETAGLWVMDLTGGSGADGVNIVASRFRSNRGAFWARRSRYDQADNSNRVNQLTTGIS